MKTYSETGLALTRSFEGLRLTAYPDLGGVWTIGYGHTGPGVHTGLTITREQAEALLAADIARAATAVHHLVTVTITQNQFDALVDFAFNLGPTTLANSTLLRDLNSGDIPSAAAQFERWDHVRGTVVPGLLRRRKAEAALFTRVAA
jgi:lysozyme